MATIAVTLTDRLVGELPRFFGGRLAALRELFQNAWRAGAKNVHARLEGNVLTFEDDGNGCPDPQLLLSAGATGWDESRIIEPAGLGFFSLLSKDVSTSVEAQSCGWRVTLIPAQVLAKKPIPVEPGEVTRGMRLRLILVDAHIQNDFEAARGYYPFRVLLNGKEVAPAALRNEVDLETPVGMLGLKRRDYRAEHPRAIWEYRAIEGSAFETALVDAARSPVEEAIAQSFLIDWVVSPASGVLPKLPDRNDLAQSSALDAAARIILNAIASHFTNEATQVTRGWPSTLPEDWHEEPAWLFRTSMGKTILAQLGWMEIKCDEWSETNIYYTESDGWQTESGVIHRFSKDYLKVRDPDVAASINNAVHLGASLPLALVDEKGAEVRLVGHRTPNKDGWVGLAREIRVGPHRLPFLARTNQDKPTIALACDADTATAAFLGRDMELPGGLSGCIQGTLEGFLALHDNDELSENWGDYDDGGSVDWHRLNRSLIEQISDDFVGGARAKARHELHRLRQERDRLASLLRDARNLAGTLRGIPMKAVAAKAEKALHALDARIARVELRAKLPK